MFFCMHLRLRLVRWCTHTDCHENFFGNQLVSYNLNSKISDLSIRLGDIQLFETSNNMMLLKGGFRTHTRMFTPHARVHMHGCS